MEDVRRPANELPTAAPLRAIGRETRIFSVRELARNTRTVLGHARSFGATVRDVDGAALVLLPRSAISEVEVLCAAMSNWLQLQAALDASGDSAPAAPLLGEWVSLAGRDVEELRAFRDRCSEHMHVAARSLDSRALMAFLAAEGVVEGVEERMERRRAAEEQRAAAVQERRRVRAERAELDARAVDELWGMTIAFALKRCEVWELALTPAEQAALRRMTERCGRGGAPWYHSSVGTAAMYPPNVWEPDAPMRRWCPQRGEMVTFRWNREFVRFWNGDL
jgi:hypothetical protein